MKGKSYQNAFLSLYGSHKVGSQEWVLMRNGKCYSKKQSFISAIKTFSSPTRVG